MFTTLKYLNNWKYIIINNNVTLSQQVSFDNLGHPIQQKYSDTKFNIKPNGIGHAQRGSDHALYPDQKGIWKHWFSRSVGQEGRGGRKFSSPLVPLPLSLKIDDHLTWSTFFNFPLIDGCFYAYCPHKNCSNCQPVFQEEHLFWISCCTDNFVYVFVIWRCAGVYLHIRNNWISQACGH